MGRTKTKPFLKRKKVPKLYFHFWPPKKCPPFFFLIHTWWCENITASPCDYTSQNNLSIMKTSTFATNLNHWKYIPSFRFKCPLSIHCEQKSSLCVPSIHISVYSPTGEHYRALQHHSYCSSVITQRETMVNNRMIHSHNYCWHYSLIKLSS
jgi:hypothetical protein